MAPPPTPLPPPDLHSPINGIHFQSGEDRGTHMAEAPKSGEDDLHGPSDSDSDSDAGSVVDDGDVSTSDSFSSGEEEGVEVEDEEAASSPRVLVVVGCRPCLSYFMVEQAAPRCPRCGDARSLVHFGG